MKDFSDDEMVGLLAVTRATTLLELLAITG